MIIFQLSLITNLCLTVWRLQSEEPEMSFVSSEHNVEGGQGELVRWALTILERCGDVEVNPGPRSERLVKKWFEISSFI